MVSQVQLQILESDPTLDEALLDQLGMQGTVVFRHNLPADEKPRSRIFCLRRSDHLDPAAMRCCVHEATAPVIFYESDPGSSRAVHAADAGALALVQWPLDAADLLPLLWPQTERGKQREETVRSAVKCRQRLYSLSDRQRDVLQYIVEGLSNKAAAMSLSISPRTVEIHRAALMKRTGACSVSDLVKIAILSGLFEDSLTRWCRTYNLSAN